MEVRNRFKGLDLIDGVPDELWTEVCDTVQETGIKTIPVEKKSKKAREFQKNILGQHKRKPEFPVVTRESHRNSRKSTCFPRLRKIRPFVRYSISREVPRSILKCETVLAGT